MVVVVFYYILVFFFLLASLGVVLSKNPIHSIFYLILIFFFASVLFFGLGLDFFAIMFLVIYVGAIAVLFLFMVMMLNVRIVELRAMFYVYMPLAIFFIFLVLLEFKYLVFSSYSDFVYPINVEYTEWFSFISNGTVIESIGAVLYNEFFILFFFSMLLLFLATFAAISLTITNKKIHYKIQNVDFQFSQTFNNRIKYNR
jgi:NADH-quinone oxidoreductase subunit J